MLTLLPLLLSPALAEPPANPTTEQLDRARELYENGEILYDEGRYEDAVVAWRQGYELSGLPDFLYNIANAQERLGDVKGALDTLGRYRAFALAEERETLDRRIRSLESRLASQPAPSPAPAPAPGPAPAPAPAPVSSESEGRRGSARPIVGGVLAGLGGASLATGAVFGLRSASAGREAEEACVTAGGGLLCPSSVDDALRTNQSSALVADLAFGAGLALLGTGTVVLLTGGGQDEGVALGFSPTGVRHLVSR